MSALPGDSVRGPVAVLGAGVMGHAIAVVFAIGGYEVRIYDPSDAARTRALALIGSALHTLTDSGVVGAEAAPDIRRRLTFAVGLSEAVSDAAIVIESITEDPDAKSRVYLQLAEATPNTAIVLSNTSYLDIFPLVPESLRDRTLIAHWYAPPYIVNLVDVVAGPSVRQAQTQAVCELLRSLGKLPVVMERFLPGFIANRIQWAITLEALRLLDDGVATPAQIDQAIIHGLSLRFPILGHLAKADFTGLEIARRSLANGTYVPPCPQSNSRTLEALCARGATGVAAGCGFYDWSRWPETVLLARRDRRLLALRRALADIGTVIDDAEAWS
jgi:3-hydroxybutyryl-CoA dehydrogenase